MSARNLLRCSKHFPHPDGDEATEVLLVQDPYGDAWSVQPRCAAHPALDDLPILNRLNPNLKAVIVPLDGAS